MKMMVAILAHEQPERLKMLVSKFRQCGVTPNLWDGARMGLKWGNLLPFQAAAFQHAREIGADRLMIADSDLIPVRKDALQIVSAFISESERQNPGCPVLFSSSTGSIHSQKLGNKAAHYPSRELLKNQDHKFAEILRQNGWNGQWITYSFNPATTFNRKAIELACQAFDQLNDDDLKTAHQHFFAGEETFIPTLLDLHGLVNVTHACMRGIRWKPHWRPNERIQGDMIFVHPVDRQSDHPLWKYGID